MAGASEPDLGWPKRLIFWSLLVLFVVTVPEIAARVYFASMIGPSVLFYGSSFERVAVDGSAERSTLVRNLRHRRMSGVDDRNHSARHPENQQSGYYKYYPGQERSTYDIDTGEVYPIEINSRGFRGPEFSDEKAPGVIRVVALGASSTFGYHDRDDLTYPAQLQRMLEARCPGARYEVINLGIPHLTTAQIVALFQAEGVRLHPDVVTFYEGFNDANAMETDEDAPLGETVGRPERLRKKVFHWFREHLILVALGDALVADWTKRYDADFVARHIEARKRGFLQELGRLREICRQHGFRFVVVSQQSRSLAVLRENIRGVTYRQEAALVSKDLERQGWLSRKELAFLTHTSLMQEEASWARGQGIPYVDALAALDDRRDEVVSWVHLSHEGNRVVADRIASALLPMTCPGARGAQPVSAGGAADRASGSASPAPSPPPGGPSASGAPAS